MNLLNYYNYKEDRYMNIPKGATHIHSGLSDNDERRFEKWKQTKTSGSFVVYNMDGKRWVFYDTFNRNDSKLKKLRVSI